MSKNTIYQLGLSAFFLLFSTGLMAQQSWPIDTINGQPAYRYTVQKSEGLFRISKNFGVTQEQLLQLNPQLETEGLRLGQTIYVPVVEQLDVAQWETHTLQPKETLYGLSRQYGVSVEELQRLNPEVSARMAIGDVLLIRKKPVEAPIEAIAPIEPIETIAPIEPSPAAEPSAEVTEVPLAPVGAQLADRESEANKERGQGLGAILPSSSPLRLAFMLPLQAGAAKRDASMDRFSDFYKGALLAIYEAQENGQTFDIYCYDVEKSDVGVQRALQKSELLTADAIIGPAYPAQVTYAALFAKQNRIPCIVPFTSKVSGIESNPYLIRFNPNEEAEAEALMQQLLPRKDSIHIVLVDAEAADRSALTIACQRAAEKAGFSIGRTSTRAILGDSLQSALVDGRENILLFNSDKFSAVQILLDKVCKQKNGMNLSLIGRYAWANEKSVLPIRYTTVFRTAETTEYDQRYEHYFTVLPSARTPRYDLIGYDLTRMTIQNILRARQTTTETEFDAAWSVPYEGLQSSIQLQRAGEQGGFINNAIQVILK